MKLKGLTQNPIKFAKILYNFYAKINFIFEEILPTIRKTGKFEAPQLTQKEQVLY